MEAEKRNKRLIWQDFLSYLTRSFTREEMHEFEREVDKSAFDFEAVEGLEPFAGASINYDIENLRDKIRGRNARHGARRKQQGFQIKNIAAIGIIFLVSGVAMSLWFLESGQSEDKRAQSENAESTESTVGNLASLTHDTLSNEKDQIAAVQAEKVSATAVGNVLQKESKAKAVGSGKASERDEDVKMEMVSLSSPSLKTATVKDSNSNSIFETSKDEQKMSIVPVDGSSALNRSLTKALNEEGFSFSGRIIVQLAFDKNGKVIKVKVISGGGAKLQDMVKAYLLEHTSWILVNKQKVPSGVYDYRLKI